MKVMYWCIDAVQTIGMMIRYVFMKLGTLFRAPTCTAPTGIVVAEGNISSHDSEKYYFRIQQTYSERMMYICVLK